jgi:hypothetical protein
MLGRIDIEGAEELDAIDRDSYGGTTCELGKRLHRKIR